MDPHDPSLADAASRLSERLGAAAADWRQIRNLRPSSWPSVADLLLHILACLQRALLRLQVPPEARNASRTAAAACRQPPVRAVPSRFGRWLGCWGRVWSGDHDPEPTAKADPPDPVPPHAPIRRGRPARPRSTRAPRSRPTRNDGRARISTTRGRHRPEPPLRLRPAAAGPGRPLRPDPAHLSPGPGRRRRPKSAPEPAVFARTFHYDHATKSSVKSCGRPRGTRTRPPGPSCPDLIRASRGRTDGRVKPDHDVRALPRLAVLVGLERQRHPA